MQQQTNMLNLFVEFRFQLLNMKTLFNVKIIFSRRSNLALQYRSNVSSQSLEARYSKLDSRSSILENFEDRGSSRVWRRSRPFENLSRPFENLSSRVSRLSSGKNKGHFARLTFDTSDFSFLYR